MLNYEIVVVDAQYFTKEDIDYLHSKDIKVFTYINIGSLENFRDYYSKYEYLALGEYENWEEEKWIDVSKKEWQEFLFALSDDLIQKGVDGFFVDNCDVYYNYQEKEIFDSITIILEKLKKSNKEVIVNGGDFYVLKYLEEKGKFDAVITGVNQESVFSSINFNDNTFGKRTMEERDYYIKYLEICRKENIDVYLLEYTFDKKLIGEIKKYCDEKGFRYYVSDSIELD